MSMKNRVYQLDRKNFIYDTIHFLTCSTLLSSEFLVKNVSASAEEVVTLEAPAFESFTAEDNSFTFSYPVGFKSYRKPLKTHKEEINFKSNDVQGYEIGVVVDPVRINSLDEFGSVELVGRRVINVELNKDGCIDAKLMDSKSEKRDNITSYTIEYFVENVHYVSQFIAKIIIRDGRLYVCTGKCKAKDFDQFAAVLRESVGSFNVIT